MLLPTVAIARLLLLQVPPGIVLVSVATPPKHTVGDEGNIAEGVTPTDTTFVTKQLPTV